MCRIEFVFSKDQGALISIFSRKCKATDIDLHGAGTMHDGSYHVRATFKTATEAANFLRWAIASKVNFNSWF